MGTRFGVKVRSHLGIIYLFFVLAAGSFDYFDSAAVKYHEQFIGQLVTAPTHQ
jgi:hypothetical protein